MYVTSKVALKTFYDGKFGISQKLLQIRLTHSDPTLYQTIPIFRAVYAGNTQEFQDGGEQEAGQGKSPDAAIFIVFVICKDALAASGHILYSLKVNILLLCEDVVSVCFRYKLNKIERSLLAIYPAKY